MQHFSSMTLTPVFSKQFSNVLLEMYLENNGSTYFNIPRAPSSDSAHSLLVLSYAYTKGLSSTNYPCPNTSLNGNLLLFPKPLTLPP